MKEGNIYDIGQTTNSLLRNVALTCCSRFLYINNKWYSLYRLVANYTRSIVFAYNYDQNELTKTVLEDDFDEVKLIGNIFDDIELKNSLNFSDCPEIITIIRDNKLNDLLS
jgi:hypothetical protein